MGLKMVKGSSFDINMDSFDGLEKDLRGKIAEKYLEMKVLEWNRTVSFYLYVSAFVLLVLLSIFVSNWFALALFPVVIALYKRHFRYLQAWSAWNKFARKWVARIDLEKEDPIYKDVKVPWVKLK